MAKSKPAKPDSTVMPRRPNPTYTSKWRLPEPLSGIVSGMKELADLGTSAAVKIGERLRTVRKSLR